MIDFEFGSGDPWAGHGVHDQVGQVQDENIPRRQGALVCDSQKRALLFVGPQRRRQDHYHQQCVLAQSDFGLCRFHH